MLANINDSVYSNKWLKVIAGCCLFLANYAYADIVANKAAVDIGIQWVNQNQNSDGSWGQDESLRYVVTSSVVDALYAANIFTGSYYAGIAWLENHHANNVDYLARKIDTLYVHGNNLVGDIDRLNQAKKGSETGWGLSSHYISSSYDTALALNALLTINQTVNVLPATNYLVSMQNTDGGWSIYNTSTSDLVVTSVVTRVLASLGSADPGVIAALTAAAPYLESTGLTSDSLVLAHVALALYQLQGQTANANLIIDELVTRQTVAGNWDDIYTSATVVRAITSVLGTDLDTGKTRVAIGDQAVRSAINTQLGKNAFDNIVQSEMATLTTLNLNGAGVTTLDGLENATSLVSIDLRGNTLTTLAPLFGLQNLTTIQIDGTGPDTDGDGMSDVFEIIYRLEPTNPLDAAFDPDNDGFTNLEEFLLGTNPNVADGNPDADADNDGLTNLVEQTIGTNPLVADTDGDGISDGIEYYGYQINPLSNDTDNDGIIDGLDPDRVPASPLATYYDEQGRIGAVMDGLNTLISYQFDGLDRIVSERRHATPPAQPIWAQHFEVDAAGFTPLPPGYMTVNNGWLVITSQDTDWAWPYLSGTRAHAYSDGVIFRAEVITGARPDGRNLAIGAHNDWSTGDYRRHAAVFDEGNLYVSSYDNGGVTDYLGKISDDTAYVVEVITHSTGSTLYIYEQGQPRSSGYQDDKPYTDWGVAVAFIEAQSYPGQPPGVMYVDNFSEAITSGHLIGEVIAVSRPEDSVSDFIYSDTGQLVGARNSTGVMYSFEYDPLANPISKPISMRQYSNTPRLALRSQHFLINAAGLSALPLDYMAVQNDRLVITSQDTDWDWPGVSGINEYALTQGVIFRSEVTTGPDSSGQYLLTGVHNDWYTGEYRRHAAIFDEGNLYVSYYDNDWLQDYLGSTTANTTYIVEVVSDSLGTTLYVYEKGQDRTSGVQDNRGFTDWGVAMTFIEAQGYPGQAAAKMYIENFSEATIQGELLGPYIVTKSPDDIITPIGSGN